MSCYRRGRPRKDLGRLVQVRKDGTLQPFLFSLAGGSSLSERGGVVNGSATGCLKAPEGAERFATNGSGSVRYVSRAWARGEHFDVCEYCPHGLACASCRGVRFCSVGQEGVGQ